MSLASELRKIAEQELKLRSDLRANALFEYLIKQADRIAKQGKTNFKFVLDRTDWSKEDAIIAKYSLENEGFKVIIDSEIGAQYSNTDWDYQDFIEISW